MNRLFWVWVLAMVLLTGAARAEEAERLSETDTATYAELRAHCQAQGLSIGDEVYTVVSTEGYTRYSWPLLEDVIFSMTYKLNGPLAFYEVFSPDGAEDYVMTATLLIHCLEDTDSINSATAVLDQLIDDLDGKAGISTYTAAGAMYTFSQLPMTGYSIRAFVSG